LPDEDGCTALPLVVAAREEINVGEVAKIYGTVEPLVVTQPYVGKMAVVEHVRWTVTVLTRASGLLA